MRIGYIQFEPLLGRPDRNLDLAVELIRGAPAADLLVLPELASSGYRFESKAEAAAAAEPTDGPYVRALEATARNRGMCLVAGLCERTGGRLFNSAVLVGPTGLIGLYRKLHLFLDEKDLFEPGDMGIQVFDAPAGRVAMLICFDWQFPETWRIAALKGADLVAHPSNLVLPGRAQRAVPVHAMANRLFVVTANRIGTERDLTFTGRSLIADPAGQVLAEAPGDQPETRVVEVDLASARDKSVTPRNDLLADRRPEHYADLTLRPGQAHRSQE